MTDKVASEFITHFTNKERPHLFTVLSYLYNKFKHAENKATLMKDTLSRIAAGRDGTMETSDDILSMDTVKKINIILENDLVEDIVLAIYKVKKDKLMQLCKCIF